MNLRVQASRRPSQAGATMLLTSHDQRAFVGRRSERVCGRAAVVSHVRASVSPRADSSPRRVARAGRVGARRARGGSRGGGHRSRGRTTRRSTTSSSRCGSLAGGARRARGSARRSTRRSTGLCGCRATPRALRPTASACGARASPTSRRRRSSARTTSRARGPSSGRTRARRAGSTPRASAQSAGASALGSAPARHPPGGSFLPRNPAGTLRPLRARAPSGFPAALHPASRVQRHGWVDGDIWRRRLRHTTTAHRWSRGAGGRDATRTAWAWGWRCGRVGRFAKLGHDHVVRRRNWRRTLILKPGVDAPSAASDAAAGDARAMDHMYCASAIGSPAVRPPRPPAQTIGGGRRGAGGAPPVLGFGCCAKAG